MENSETTEVKAAPAAFSVIKSFVGSWVVLVMAILATAAAVCSAIAVFTTLSGGVIPIMKSLIQLLLSVILCVGFWRTYMTGKSNSDRLNPGGPKLLRGMFNFYRTITYIAMILVIILLVLMFVTLKSCADAVTDTAVNVGDVVDSSGNTSETIRDINAGFTGIMVGLLIGAVAIFALMVFFYQSVYTFVCNAVNSLTTWEVDNSKAVLSAVLFFILGGFMLLSSFGTTFIMSVISDMVGQMGDGLGFIKSGVSSMSDIDVPSLISGIANAGLYVFGGVLALQYNGVKDKIANYKQTA